MGQSPCNSLVTTFEIASADGNVDIYGAAAADGDVVTDGAAAAVQAATAVGVWVQQCYMRACTNPQFHVVLMVVTLREK